MFEVPARQFTVVTSTLLLAATALLALGVERLARGVVTLGYALVAAGALATVLAFLLRVEGDPQHEALVLLTREDCPLCDEALAVLRHVQKDAGFDLWVVDIGADQALAVHSDEVPVVVRRGEAVLSMQVSEADVRGLFG